MEVWEESRQISVECPLGLPEHFLLSAPKRLVTESVEGWGNFQGRSARLALEIPPPAGPFLPVFKAESPRKSGHSVYGFVHTAGDGNRLSRTLKK